MTSKENEIMVNIVGGVESGGQIYGNRDYAAYAPPYHASPDEHTVTLGWAQFYGGNAQRLVKNIYKSNPSAVPANIVQALNNDWVATRWNPTSSQKQSLISAITSTAGKKCQDELFVEITQPVIKEAEKYTSDVGCQIMYVEIAHLGGDSAAKRIFNKMSKPYTVDKIFDTLMLDQRDTSNNNQVGDKVYQSRHECCVRWIKQYLTTTTTTPSTTKGSDPVAEQEIKGGNYISNSGSDENGRATGGKAGDQTGNEWTIRGWYNRPWDCVLRYPDANVANKISELAIKAARNAKIGYNQNNRYSYWTLLQKANYDPSAITTACDADCSAGVIANTKATGYILGIPALKNIWATYTGNMRQSFREAGFKVLTESKYLTGPDYLLPGDILLNDVHHTATCVSVGSKAKATQSSTTTATTQTTQTTKSTPKAWSGVTKKRIQARTWAGDQYPEVSFSPLKKGTPVEVQYSIKDSNGAEWHYFKTTDNKYAFIPANSVEAQDTAIAQGQYRVQSGVFSEQANAERQLATVKQAGLDAILEKTSGGYYVVQLGMFSKLANANKLKKQAQEAGIDVAVVKL